jgi:hypothetical protein
MASADPELIKDISYLSFDSLSWLLFNRVGQNDSAETFKMNNEVIWKYLNCII